MKADKLAVPAEPTKDRAPAEPSPAPSTCQVGLLDAGDRQSDSGFINAAAELAKDIGRILPKCELGHTSRPITKLSCRDREDCIVQVDSSGSGALFDGRIDSH
jgi:hypothetical protein